MKYNFDEIIEREGTNSVKWDTKALKKFMGYVDKDVLPLWVADMDFRCPQTVIDALKMRIEHGIFGYSAPLDDYYEALIWWQETRHDWKIKPEWVSMTPGVVPAMNFIIRALTNEGDKVIIQQPVYYPFKAAVENNKRVIVNNALRFENGNYFMNFEDLEEKARDPKVKLLILCSPHNPVGRIWSREELQKLGDICNKNNVIVVADEIHNDLIMPGNKHFTYALLGEEYANNSLICTAPSKTFNLAGMQTSNIIIQNNEIKAKVDAELSKSSLTLPNLFGLVATTAAYSISGVEWLEQLLEYLGSNADFIGEYVKEKMPGVKYIRPQGTYLAWLDFREVESNWQELERKVKDEAKVLLDGGSMFGPGGEGFMRVNIACPRLILEKALDRIKEVFYK